MKGLKGSRSSDKDNDEDEDENENENVYSFSSNTPLKGHLKDQHHHVQPQRPILRPHSPMVIDLRSDVEDTDTDTKVKVKQRGKTPPQRQTHGRIKPQKRLENKIHNHATPGQSHSLKTSTSIPLQTSPISLLSPRALVESDSESDGDSVVSDVPSVDGGGGDSGGDGEVTGDVNTNSPHRTGRTQVFIPSSSSSASAPATMSTPTPITRRVTRSSFGNLGENSNTGKNITNRTPSKASVSTNTESSDKYTTPTTTRGSKRLRPATFGSLRDEKDTPTFEPSTTPPRKKLAKVAKPSTPSTPSTSSVRSTSSVTSSSSTPVRRSSRLTGRGGEENSLRELHGQPDSRSSSRSTRSGFVDISGGRGSGRGSGMMDTTHSSRFGEGPETRRTSSRNRPRSRLHQPVMPFSDVLRSAVTRRRQ